MNKAITIGLIGLLIFFGIQHSQQNKVLEETEVMDYLSFTGTITEVRESSVLVQEKVNAENLMVFNISESVLLLDDSTQETADAGSFKVGQEVTAFYPKNAPMALSFPAIITPDVLVRHSDQREGFVQVATFDDTLTSSDGQLKIILDVGMSLIDRHGKPVASLAHKTLVVFYTTSTRSIPAQITPEKIIVL